MTTTGNKVDQALKRLDDLGYFLSLINTFSSENETERLGFYTLLNIYETHDIEGIRDFLRWAVHPICGFMPQNSDIKPFPESLAPLFDYMARGVNGKNAAKNREACVDDSTRPTDYQCTSDDAARAASQVLEELLSPNRTRSASR